MKSATRHTASQNGYHVVVDFIYQVSFFIVSEVEMTVNIVYKKLNHTFTGHLGLSFQCNGALRLSK